MKTPALLVVSVLAGFAAGAATVFSLRQQPGKSGIAAEPLPAVAQSSADVRVNGPVATSPAVRARPEAAPTDSQSLADRLGIALAEKGRSRRHRSILALSDEVTSENARELAEIVRGQPKGMNLEDLSIIIEAWAGKDPAAALAYAQALHDARMRKLALIRVASGWAESDPTGAVQWAGTLTDNELKRTAEMLVLNTIAESDPERALSLMNATESSERSTEIAYSLFSSWATRDPQAAALRAAALPAGQLRNYAIEIVARHWAQNDVAAALEWTQQFPASSPAMQNVINAWAVQDAPAAIAWVQKLPPDGRQTQLLSSVLEYWA